MVSHVTERLRGEILKAKVEESNRVHVQVYYAHLPVGGRDRAFACMNILEPPSTSRPKQWSTSRKKISR